MTLNPKDYLFAVKLLKFMMVDRQNWRPGLAEIPKDKKEIFTQTLEEKIKHTMYVNNFQAKFVLWFKKRELTIKFFKKLLELVTADFCQKEYDEEKFVDFCSEIASLGHMGYDIMKETPDLAMYCIIHALQVFRGKRQFDDTSYKSLTEWAKSVMKHIEKYPPSSPLFSNIESPQDDAFSSDTGISEIDSGSDNSNQEFERVKLSSPVPLKVRMVSTNAEESSASNQNLYLREQIDKVDVNAGAVQITNTKLDNSEFPDSKLTSCYNSLMSGLKALKLKRNKINYSQTPYKEMKKEEPIAFNFVSENANKSGNATKSLHEIHSSAIELNNTSNINSNQTGFISRPVWRLQRIPVDISTNKSILSNSKSKQSVCRNRSLGNYYIKERNDSSDSDEDDKIKHEHESKEESFEDTVFFSSIDYTKERRGVYQQVTPHKIRVVSEKSKLDVLSPQSKFKTSPNPKPLKRLKSYPYIKKLDFKHKSSEQNDRSTDFNEDKKDECGRQTCHRERVVSGKSKLDIVSPKGKLKTSPNPKPLKRLKSCPDVGSPTNN